MQVLRFRGRVVSERDVAFIRELIAQNPWATRFRLSKLLCEAWDWRQPNGQLKDMVCRSLMLALDRNGQIELPAARLVAPNNVVLRHRPVPVEVDRTPLVARLKEIQPLSIAQVRRSGEERLVDGLIEEHHYLGYIRPVGEHLKYLVRGAGDRPLACMTWSSAPRHLGPRDRFIGWSAEARHRNVHLLAYNPRYLILPWVRVKHLASHLLGRVARRIAADWEALYGHPVHYLETFVHPDRFPGTCYRAANWVRLGLTTGRGKADLTHKQNRPKKEVLGLPLRKDFRLLLGEVG
jgi:hypothetical protein